MSNAEPRELLRRPKRLLLSLLLRSPELT